MNTQAPEEIWLRNYLQGFLWADEDWLEVDNCSATYWQARLAQTTTVESLPAGRAKWRVRTRVVDQVAETADAPQLCLALNRYAAGWSFAYDAEAQTIDAVVAICASPAWDTFILRLSEKAKLSAWMSDVIAERLAAAVGGLPAFSHPDRQSGVRTTFDATYYYLETVRGRPEWILDLTRYEFPPLEEIATGIAQMVDVPESELWCDRDQLRIPLAHAPTCVLVQLHAGFGRHPVVGDGWHSSIRLPCDQITRPLAEQLSAMTWELFNEPQTNLLGGWTRGSDELIFQQWNTMSEARNQEQLGSYDGRAAGDLWAFTSTVSDAVGTVVRTELTMGSEDEPDSGASDRAARVIAAIAERARPAVQEHPSESDEHADRRLLWLERTKIVGVAVWFNPIGPTVASIEVCAIPDGTEYLVYFRRHPSAPYYCVLGVVTPGPELAEIQAAGTDMLVDGSLPNVLVQWNNPDATAADVPHMLRDRVIEIAQQTDGDLTADAAWIKETMGRPWDFAAVDPSVSRAFRAAAREKASSQAEPDHGFSNWWEQVSRAENVIANFRCLPDAWDGALNTLKGFGNLGLFDVGPLLLTYSTIGTPEAGMKPPQRDSGSS